MSSARDEEPQRRLRHELRTPINQIIGYSEMLAEMATEEGLVEYVADLEKIGMAARRLTPLLDELIDHGSTRALRSIAGRRPRVEQEAVRREDQESATGGGTGHLLVVDDSAENRDMLARRLRRSGYEVEVAEDGEGALALLAARPFDLVLLDIMMPGIDGLEVLARVRAEQAAAELPVIMVTARTASEDVVLALRRGANDYVTKPLEFPVVLARVETHLALKRARDEACQLAEQLAGRNRFIRKTFGRYLSEEIVDTLLDSPAALQLGGERRTCTILLTDLRGFTSLSARLEPEDVIGLLNGYLESMTEIIGAHGGTIDEIIGDAILVLFGAPVGRHDDARRAVSCAIAMQLAMPEVNRRNREQGWPEVEMGIALNTGELVVGNIGSSQRMKYGVVGTPINVAARLESTTVGGQVVLSESTRAAAGKGVLVGDSLQVRAKGLDQPVTAWDLLGLQAGEKELRLPQAQDPLRSLAEPLQVRYQLLEGKQETGEEREGQILRLSERRAELRTTGTLPSQGDLKLCLLDEAGASRPGSIQARLRGRSHPTEPVFAIHFTSVPPELASSLEQARESLVD